jgi:hypothetical protein
LIFMVGFVRHPCADGAAHPPIASPQCGRPDRPSVIRPGLARGRPGGWAWGALSQRTRCRDGTPTSRSGPAWVGNRLPRPRHENFTRGRPMGWVWGRPRCTRQMWGFGASMPGPHNVNQAHLPDEFDRLL